MLDVRRLRVLREVALRGSIAGAAESLRFTPSAVSQQVAKLEREAGVALVERGPRSVSLTPAGWRLVEHAEAILERLAAAETELRDLAGSTPVLRVGANTTAAVTIVPGALTRFTAVRPDVEVAVAESDPLISLARLCARELDLAIVFEYDHVPLPHDPRIAIETLLEEPMRIVLPAGHPVARQRAVRLLDLAEDTWICSTPRSSCHPFTERACRAAGFDPRIRFEFDDYAAMQSLVASGAGVAFAPDMGLTRLNPGVAVRPIAFGPKRRVHAALRAGEGSSTGVPEMLSALRQSVAACEPLFPAAAGA
ncbi:MAG TPA: LysR family transcriptional regulator [Gaiellaceae bacterium]|jgi:DNA-binding transcriptional LysR family regulator|nr:LysR family transcriptional regulator [Gaiellaceae bacterium]